MVNTPLANRAPPIYIYIYIFFFFNLFCYLGSKFSMSHTVYFCHIQSVSVRESLCLSETIGVCQRQSVSVTDSLWLSQTVVVHHRKTFSVSMCLSLTLCICHRQYVLSQTVFVCQSVSLSITLLDHPWSDFFLIIHDFHHCLWNFSLSEISIKKKVDPCFQPFCATPLFTYL